MSNPFLAEIRLFAGNFPPKGWAFCDGQLIAISQNTALFSLRGTFYGGDGKTTFALPDLRDRLPISQGQGPGLTDHVIGETGGEEFVTLIASELPSHTHSMAGTDAAATSASPQGGYLAKASSGRTSVNSYASPGTPAAMSFQSTDATGGSQPHNNLPPVLGLSYIIALQGVFPARN